MRIIPIMLLSVLTGCNSVFDPTPYDPRVPATTSTTTLFDNFDTLVHAKSSLEQLAAGYSQMHDAAASQQLIFDVPMIGMGVAAVANPIFHGANAATVALGLGSGGVAATKLYFGPQVKASAYLTASQSLFCAYGVASKLYAIQNPIKPLQTPDSMSTSLSEAISDALTAEGAASTPTTTSAAIVAAIPQAQASLVDFENARTVLSYAPSGLQTFALATASGATTKVTTGTQDIDAVLAQLKVTQVSPSNTPAPSSPPPAAPRVANVITPEQTLSNLLQTTAESQALTKTINDSWSGLANCAAVY